MHKFLLHRRDSLAESLGKVSFKQNCLGFDLGIKVPLREFSFSRLCPSCSRVSFKFARSGTFFSIRTTCTRSQDSLRALRGVPIVFVGVGSGPFSSYFFIVARSLGLATYNHSSLSASAACFCFPARVVLLSSLPALSIAVWLSKNRPPRKSVLYAFDGFVVARQLQIKNERISQLWNPVWSSLRTTSEQSSPKRWRRL